MYLTITCEREGEDRREGGRKEGGKESGGGRREGGKEELCDE